MTAHYIREAERGAGAEQTNSRDQTGQLMKRRWQDEEGGNKKDRTKSVVEELGRQSQGPSSRRLWEKIKYWSIQEVLDNNKQQGAAEKSWQGYK